MQDQLTEMKAALTDLQAAAGRIKEIDRLTAALDVESKARADLAERLAEVETKAGRPGFAPAAGGGKSTLNAEFKALALGRAEAKTTMTGTSNPAGGFAVSVQFDSVLSRLLREVSPMRQVARVVRAETSDFRALVSKNGATAAWAGEGQTRAQTAAVDLARVQIAPGEVYAYPMSTAEILEDASFDAEAFLREEVALAMAAAEGAAFVAGDGVSKPHGFLNVPRSDDPDATREWPRLQTVKTGGATITAPSLIDLVYSLKPAFRARAAWAMNASTIAAVQKLVDGAGRFIWADSLAAGQPARLLGYPVVEMPDMPDVGTDATPVAFGDWATAYTIVDVGTPRVVPDPVTAPGFVKLYIARRVGGAVTNSHALKLLRVGN